jgi:methyltransferase family protein
MRRHRTLIHQLGRRLARRIARRAGLDVVRGDFYSPIVDAAALPAELWEQPSPMPGLTLDLDAQLRFLDAELMPFILEFASGVQAGRSGPSIPLENPFYGPMDSHVLYGMLRRFRPRRVLELGSGYSTLIAEQALTVNRTERGIEAQHDIVDPFPSPLLDSIAADVNVHPVSGASIPANWFTALGHDDVLFVDTSHTVKPGGEVVRLVLEALGELRPGVIVHFHDIFRPFPYPRVLYERFGVHWQEQYLLQALLAANPHFEVLCANHALWRLRREAVIGRFAGLREGMEPSGFWFRRR